MMPQMHRAVILRRTYVKGELKKPGDIVELDEPDFNAFLHFAKAKPAPPVGDAPKADERESELQSRMSKRKQPKAPKKEVVDNG